MKCAICAGLRIFYYQTGPSLCFVLLCRTLVVCVRLCANDIMKFMANITSSCTFHMWQNAVRFSKMKTSLHSAFAFSLLVVSANAHSMMIRPKPRNAIDSVSERYLFATSSLTSQTLQSSLFWSTDPSCFLSTLQAPESIFYLHNELPIVWHASYPYVPTIRSCRNGRTGNRHTCGTHTATHPAPAETDLTCARRPKLASGCQSAALSGAKSGEYDGRSRWHLAYLEY